MAEAIITMPDGRRARITGPSREGLRQKAEQLKNQGMPGAGRPPRVVKDQSLGQDAAQIQEGFQGGGATFGEFGLRRFLNNLMAIPSATGEALALGGGALQSLMTDQGFDESVEQQRGQFPASALRAVPSPTTSDIVAGGQAVTGAAGNLLQGQPADLGGEFGQASQDQAQRLEQLRGQQPFAAAAGETAGDIGTILAGRAPRVTRQAARRRATREAAEAAPPPPRLPEAVQSEVDDVISSKVGPFFKRRVAETKRGLGRVAETGTEGAALALLNEGDPISTGMFAAGGQTLGSLSLTLATHPVKALLPTVATAFVASEMFKAATPGGQNLFESKDFAIQKATAALALGAASAAMGAGRLRGKATERLPKFLDAVTAVPRGAVLSRLQELTNESQRGNAQPLTVMETFARNPGEFNENERRSLGRALHSDKPGAWIKEVERQMKRESFREKVEALQ